MPTAFNSVEKNVSHLEDRKTLQTNKIHPTQAKLLLSLNASLERVKALVFALYRWIESDLKRLQFVDRVARLALRRRWRLAREKRQLDRTRAQLVQLVSIQRVEQRIQLCQRRLIDVLHVGSRLKKV